MSRPDTIPPGLDGSTPAEWVAAHPLLRLVPEELRPRLLERVRVRPSGPGEAITREGREATRFYVLVSGTARVSCTRPDGGQERVARLVPGAFFGAVGPGDGGRRVATVAATSRAVCLEFPLELLHGAPRSPDGRLSLVLREILAIALNHQLRAANLRLARLGRRLAGDSAEDEDGASEGGWVQPD